MKLKIIKKITISLEINTSTAQVCTLIDDWSFFLKLSQYPLKGHAMIIIDLW